MTNFPNQISFLSDDTVAKLVAEIIDKKAKERTATYVYTVAKVNLGKEFPLSLNQILSLKNSNLIVCQ